ncbi:MAG: helical backbone metal receptor [Salinivirgaceae bacterium]|jgi:ABC-type Fe3+-hydroxamate transport system substrate-binding protein|nr:helical backbone metal receptor [Salinivirgaceae bacterium]
MKRSIKTFLFFGLTSIILFSCNSNNSSSHITAVKNGAMRIVSLAPSISKELTYLGVADNIVGVTSYCDLAMTNKDLIVGTAIDINVEKILLLKPDLVIATGLTKATNIESLEQNGVKVYQVGKMSTYNEICNEFLAIGKMVKKEQESIAIISKTNRKIDSLRNSIPEGDSLQVFFQIGAKPLFGVIPHTFMDDLITYAKCKNLAYDMQHGTVSRETVINRNPDVIYVATMGIVGDEEKNIWESYTELNAVKNKKVMIINSNMACTPSVTAFLESLTQMIEEIHN